jgi:hypothetical protein
MPLNHVRRPIFFDAVKLRYYRSLEQTPLRAYLISSHLVKSQVAPWQLVVARGIQIRCEAHLSVTWGLGDGVR